MAHFARLIIFIGVFWSNSTFAAYTCSFGGSTGTHATDSSQAYGAMSAAFNARRVPFGPGCNPQGLYYQQLSLVSSSPPVFSSRVDGMGSCVSSAPFDISCSGAPDEVACPSGQTRDPETNICDCDSNYQVGGQMVTGDSIDGCKGGCKILLRSGWYDKTANVTWGRDWLQTGSSCTVGDNEVLAPTDSKVTEAQKCGAGLCPGTVNGQTVCVACTSPRETTTNKDASSEVNTPASGVSSATSSSSSGSSTTKCEGDKCTTTTTTTTTNPDGSKTDKTSTKEQPKSDFCTDNPRSAICKEGGTWGGSCGAFSCDGDAVTCAIAQASWKSACALDIEPTDSKVQAGNTALSGGDRPAGHPGNNPSSSLFTANLDQTNPYGSTCPADIPLNVMGNVVSIPLSSACDTFKFMGQVAVAFTLLAAAFVIFGGVKG